MPLSEMRKMNFGKGLLKFPLTEDALGLQMDRYASAQSAEVCDLVRKRCGIEKTCERMLQVYQSMASEKPAALVSRWTLRPDEISAFLEPLLIENAAFRMAYRDCKRRLGDASENTDGEKIIHKSGN